MIDSQTVCVHHIWQGFQKLIFILFILSAKPIIKLLTFQVHWLLFWHNTGELELLQMCFKVNLAHIALPNACQNQHIQKYLKVYYESIME